MYLISLLNRLEIVMGWVTPGQMLGKLVGAPTATMVAQLQSAVTDPLAIMVSVALALAVAVTVPLAVAVVVPDQVALPQSIHHVLHW